MVANCKRGVRCIWTAELTHRGQQIVASLISRRQLRRERRSHLAVTINGVPAHFHLDTGAAVSVLDTSKRFRQYQNIEGLSELRVNLGYNRETVVVRLMGRTLQHR